MAKIKNPRYVYENKLYIKVPKEFDQEFTSWAVRMGLTKSQWGAICVQTGMNHIIQTINPLEAISSEKLVAIIKAAQNSGVDAAELEKQLAEKGGEKK